MRVEQVMYPALRQVVKRPKLAEFVLGRDRWGNPFSEAAYADPHTLTEVMRADGPVAYHRLYQQWFVFGYDECREVLTSDATTNTAQVDVLLHVRPYSKLSDRSKQFVATFLNFTDPPQHTRLRSLVSRAFTPARVRDLEPQVGPIVDELLDGLPERTSFDVMQEFAVPLPVNVIATLLGLPRERWEWSRRTTDHIVQLADPFVGFDPATMNAAIDEVFEYYGDLAEQRRADPQDDLISALVAAEEDGDRLSHDELVAVVFFLMAAGHETTTRLLGNSILALAQHPAERAKVQAAPELWLNAVDELARFDTSVRNIPRATTREIELAGVTIPAGANIVVALGAANRDRARFDRPDELQLDRHDPSPLSFAHGAHYCVGAALARMELRVGLKAFVDAMGDYTVDDVTGWNESLVLRGPLELVVRPSPGSDPGV